MSEYGVISQIPIDRITLMTTGRSGSFHTPYGVIEFVHTQRSPSDVRNGTLDMSSKEAGTRPLRLARVDTALRDLHRVGRNLHLVNGHDYKEVLREQRAYSQQHETPRQEVQRREISEQGLGGPGRAT